MSEPSSTHEQIMKSLIEKGGLKLDVFKNTQLAFGWLKSSLRDLELSLRKEMQKIDKRVVIKYIDRGPFSAEFRISDDVLIFNMHTNIFTFHESHSIWRTSYVQDQNLRTFSGMISIYNFLTDSLNLNRSNDVGYLIARIFVNKEMHYFMEGKKQLGFLFNDFGHEVINELKIKAIVESAVAYCLNFDIYTPPFDKVNVISVQEVTESSLSNLTATGKRLGFKLQSDSDLIE